jgi:hypothetical protein
MRRSLKHSLGLLILYGPIVVSTTVLTCFSQTLDGLQNLPHLLACFHEAMRIYRTLL